MNEEPMEKNDVDDQPTPMVRIPQAREYAHKLSNLAVNQSPTISYVDTMNMHSFMDILSKMSIPNINKHH